MMNKIAAAIGGNSVGPPPAPITSAASIIFTPMIKPSDSGDRTFASCLKHQFDHVNRQVESGLILAKRTCVYARTVVESLDHSADAKKLTADLHAKWQSDPPLDDAAAHFVNAHSMASEVLMHSYTAHENFRRSLLLHCIQPLHAFYKSAQMRRKELAKDHVRMLLTWNNVEEALSKERKECLKSYLELRQAQDARDKEKPYMEVQKENYPKLVRKVASAKEVALKKFQAFEKSWEKAKALQESNDTHTLPSMMSELEGIERERLLKMTEYMLNFQALFQKWTDELKSSSDLLNKAVPTLERDRSISLMLDKFTMTFGMPPPLVKVVYDLPCSPIELQLDQLPPDGTPFVQYLPTTMTANIIPNASSANRDSMTSSGPSISPSHGGSISGVNGSSSASTSTNGINGTSTTSSSSSTTPLSPRHQTTFSTTISAKRDSFMATLHRATASISGTPSSSLNSSANSSLLANAQPGSFSQTISSPSIQAQRATSPTPKMNANTFLPPSQADTSNSSNASTTAPTTSTSTTPTSTALPPSRRLASSPSSSSSASHHTHSFSTSSIFGGAGISSPPMSPASTSSILMNGSVLSMPPPARPPPERAVPERTGSNSIATATTATNSTASSGVTSPSSTQQHHHSASASSTSSPTTDSASVSSSATSSSASTPIISPKPEIAKLMRQKSLPTLPNAAMLFAMTNASGASTNAPSSSSATTTTTSTTNAAAPPSASPPPASSPTAATTTSSISEPVSLLSSKIATPTEILSPPRVASPGFGTGTGASTPTTTMSVSPSLSSIMQGSVPTSPVPASGGGSSLASLPSKNNRGAPPTLPTKRKPKAVHEHDDSLICFSASNTSMSNPPLAALSSSLLATADLLPPSSPIATRVSSNNTLLGNLSMMSLPPIDTLHVPSVTGAGTNSQHQEWGSDALSRTHSTNSSPRGSISTPPPPPPPALMSNPSSPIPSAPMTRGVSMSAAPSSMSRPGSASISSQVQAFNQQQASSLSQTQSQSHSLTHGDSGKFSARNSISSTSASTSNSASSRPIGHSISHMIANLNSTLTAGAVGGGAAGGSSSHAPSTTHSTNVSRKPSIIDTKFGNSGAGSNSTSTTAGGVVAVTEEPTIITISRPSPSPSPSPATPSTNNTSTNTVPASSSSTPTTTYPLAHALFDFKLANTPDIVYLTFKADDRIRVIQQTQGDEWWYGELIQVGMKNGPGGGDVMARGFFPFNYIKLD